MSTPNVAPTDPRILSLQKQPFGGLKEKREGGAGPPQETFSFGPKKKTTPPAAALGTFRPAATILTGKTALGV